MRALAAATRALLRRLSERLRRAGAGWARLERGSIWTGKPFRSDAARVQLRLSCPTLAGALRVDTRRSARLSQGAARVWVWLQRGAAVSGSAQLGAAQGGAGPLPSSEWHVTCQLVASLVLLAASLNRLGLPAGAGAGKLHATRTSGARHALRPIRPIFLWPGVGPIFLWTPSERLSRVFRARASSCELTLLRFRSLTQPASMALTLISMAINAHTASEARESDRATNGPVWSLIQRGKVSAVRELLAAGLDPESTVTKGIVLVSEKTNRVTSVINVAGRTLLAAAACYGDADIVSMILQAGARVERQVRACCCIDSDGPGAAAAAAAARQPRRIEPETGGARMALLALRGRRNGKLARSLAPAKALAVDAHS